MSKRDPLVLLEDIMMAIQKICRYTAGMDHGSFLLDELVIDGVARNLEIIGEAARQLPGEFRRKHCCHLPQLRISEHLSLLPIKNL